jgi:hypothetical protein
LEEWVSVKKVSRPHPVRRPVSPLHFAIGILFKGVDLAQKGTSAYKHEGQNEANPIEPT